MNAIGVLTALEREKALLEDIICLSSEQLFCLDNDDLNAFDLLFERRSQVMAGLTALDDTLAPWIKQIQSDPVISEDAMHQIKVLNYEITCMANHVVQIDEATCSRLEGIKRAQRAQLQADDREGLAGRRA